jgi:antitoxin VapB
MYGAIPPILLPEAPMALSIKNPVAERLTHELVRETGESLTEAVTVALRERLAARRRQQQPGAVLQEVAALQTFLREQPDRDPARRTRSSATTRSACRADWG